MATAAAESQRPWSMKRVVAASSAGTAFEWYDFFIFGSLATTIQKVFFAGLDPTAGLVAALGLFAAGFAFRPLGAIIFGVIGDRLGRKGAFLATVSLMGGATFLIGVLPTYATAGIISPILLILLRILQGFLDWGWRVPFLISVVLLIISVWLRFKLSESPAFARLKEEGEVTKAPLREAFTRWDNLKRVLIAFFGIMCAQGAVWYLSFFYVQVFLTKSLGVPEPTKDALVLAVTVASAPLYVFFGWLSDRVGRKPVMLGGMLLALFTYYPGFHGIASAANPALVEAQARRPVEVHADPATCTVQFDPVGTRRFDSGCDIAKSLLASAGISYKSRSYTGDTAIVAVGVQQIEVPDGRRLDGAGLKALKDKVGGEIKTALAAEGYPSAVDPRRMNIPMIFFWLMVFAVAA